LVFGRGDRTFGTLATIGRMQYDPGQGRRNATMPDAIAFIDIRRGDAGKILDRRRMTTGP